MTVWHKIETAPASAAFLSWRHRFGGDVASLAGWFLKNSGARASHVPCPRQCGCIHRVTADNDAVCPCDDCEPIPVSAADVQIWSADWPALGNRVRAALDLEHKPARSPLTNVWQIGAYGGDALQILLVVQSERHDFNETIAQLVARLPGRFVILTPTLMHHDIESRELLARVHAAHYDLASNLSLLPSGHLVARKTADALFSRHLPENRSVIDATEAARVIATLEKLKSKRAGIKAPLFDVFLMIVKRGLSQRAAATECGCSPALINDRLRELERQLGHNLKTLQAIAANAPELNSSVKGQRYRKKSHGAQDIEEVDEADPALDET